MEEEGQETVGFLFDKGARPQNQREEDRLIKITFNRSDCSLAKRLVGIGVDPVRIDKHGWSLRLSISPEDESKSDFMCEARGKIRLHTSWSPTHKTDSPELNQDNKTVKLAESESKTL